MRASVGNGTSQSSHESKRKSAQRIQSIIITTHTNSWLNDCATLHTTQQPVTGAETARKGT